MGEVFEDGSFIIDTPGEMALFRLLQFKHALLLEIKTGLHHSRGSVLAVANYELGKNFRRKQQMVDHIQGMLDEMEKEAHV